MEKYIGEVLQKDGMLELKNQENSFFLKVEPVRDGIVRVRYSRKEITDQKSELVEDEKKIPIHSGGLQKTEDKAILPAGRLTAELDLHDGRIIWKETEGGRVLLREGKRTLTEIPVYRYSTCGEEPVINRVKTVDGERNFIQNLQKVEDRKAYRGQLHFCFQEQEGIYGFGQAEEGIYNLRHHNQYLYQHNMRIPMPMFYSDEGYGILFDCSSLMTFQDDENGSYLYMDTIDQMDYYVIAGPSADEVIDGFRWLTGKAVMLPKWAFGYVQSKEQYYTADELVSVIRHYRDLQIPVDCVVQDWNSWAPGDWGEKKVDRKRYGNLKECMDEIHRMHAHTMVSVWPNMNSTTSNYQELTENGYMLNDCATYNAFDENARAMYWKQAKEELFDGGFDSWWCDSTEPFSGPDWGGEVKREPWERYELVGSEHKKYLDPAQANLYALMHAKGIYENQKADTKEKRVLNLTRSGYASGQKYGAMLWSGDTYASWETLKKQIVEGLNMGLSGYPFWTLDIGGFFTVGKAWKNRGCGCNTDPTPKWFWCGAYDEGVKDAGYRELYVRWLEMGTFLPMFRSHGTDTPREIWNFGSQGDPFYDAIAKFIRLRYLLMPYIYSMAGAVRIQNATMMRSLLFDFREDKKAKTVRDEFLFGRALLICPVTEPMYYDAGNRKLEKSSTECSRSCYLPEGTGWTDFWTGEHFEGGQTVVRETPLDIIPVFIRDGSVIPMKEKMQYAGDRKDEPVILQITPGADGSFTYYEDEENNYNYESGAFSTVDISWTEHNSGTHTSTHTGTLRIGAREGSYPGMPQKQNFLLRIRGKEDRQITYTGEEISIEF